MLTERRFAWPPTARIVLEAKVSIRQLKRKKKKQNKKSRISSNDDASGMSAQICWHVKAFTGTR